MGGAIRKKWTSGGAMGAPWTPFFNKKVDLINKKVDLINKKVDLINKKVDLSCLWGGASAPLAPPLATGLIEVSKYSYEVKLLTYLRLFSKLVFYKRLVKGLSWLWSLGCKG